MAKKVFKHYCAQEGKATFGDPKKCALSEINAGESEVEIEIFEEPKAVVETPKVDGSLMEKIVVNIKDAEADGKLIEAYALLHKQNGT